MQTPYETSLYEKTAKDHQVGGTHYGVMKIQPALFSRANDYDSDAFSILKYLSRHKAKKGREDVEKALSFVYIRIDNGEFNVTPRWSKISMQEYIAANAIDKLSANALFILHAWVLSANSSTLHTALQGSIQDILNTQYPTI